MTVPNFPRSQHWTTGKDGFRVTVLLYKSHRRERCFVCGSFGAIHAVWADGQGLRTGFSGAPEDFCDAHRPAKGTLPPLDYKRVVQGANIGADGKASRPVIYERLAPYPEQACATCGDPALFEVIEHCRGCDDPAQQYTSRLTRVTLDGVTEGSTEVHHRLHTVREWWACATHSPGTFPDAS